MLQRPTSEMQISLKSSLRLLRNARKTYYQKIKIETLEQVNEIICSYGIIDAIDAYENIHGSIQKTEYDIVYFLLREKIDYEDFLDKLKTDP